MENIGTRIKTLRQQNNDSSIAAFAADAGVSKNTLIRYENGANSPDAAFVTKICTLCRVEPKWLLFGEGPMHWGDASTRQGKALLTMVQDEMRRRSDCIEQIHQLIQQHMSTPGNGYLSLEQFMDATVLIAKCCLNPDGTVDRERALAVLGRML